MSCARSSAIGLHPDPRSATASGDPPCFARYDRAARRSRSALFVRCADGGAGRRVGHRAGAGARSRGAQRSSRQPPAGHAHSRSHSRRSMALQASWLTFETATQTVIVPTLGMPRCDNEARHVASRQQEIARGNAS
jgi:hypothetical protein